MGGWIEIEHMKMEEMAVLKLEGTDDEERERALKNLF